MTEILKVN